MSWRLVAGGSGFLRPSEGTFADARHSERTFADPGSSKFRFMNEQVTDHADGYLLLRIFVSLAQDEALHRDHYD